MLRLVGDILSDVSEVRSTPFTNAVPNSLILSALKMEMTCSSET
jgi:hypothetical protein